MAGPVSHWDPAGMHVFKRAALQAGTSKQVHVTATVCDVKGQAAA